MDKTVSVGEDSLCIRTLAYRAVFVSAHDQEGVSELGDGWPPYSMGERVPCKDVTPLFIHWFVMFCYQAVEKRTSWAILCC